MKEGKSTSQQLAEISRQLHEIRALLLEALQPRVSKPRSVITPEVVAAGEKLFLSGLSVRAVAKKLNISQTSAFNLRRSGVSESKGRA